jgi:predicted HTH domain antitoxin
LDGKKSAGREGQSVRKVIKLDASGLIYLTKAGLLDLVKDLYDEVIITDAVYHEAVLQGKAGGYPDALVIEQAIAEGHTQVKQLSPATGKRLQEGARRARLEYAAELYRQQEVTLERAAEVAAVSIYDMMAYLRQQGISRPSHIREMRADVAAMLIRSGRPDIAEQIVPR